MHERSLLVTLLKQVSAIQVEHGGAAVQEIAVEAGSLSGVEPLLLQNAFLEFAPRFPEAILSIQRTPVTARCQTCHHSWSMDVFLSECPACHQPRVQITGGDEFRLISVTLKDHDRGCLP